MGGGITRRPKGGSQRQCASVELLLHGVFRLANCLDELIEVLLHTCLLGKRHRQLLGRTARQEDGLRPSPTQKPEVVGGDLECPHLMDWEQEGPSVKTRVEVVQRASVTDQLVGIGQNLVGLPRLALVAIVGAAVHLRHVGVDMVVGNPVEDVDKPRRDAPMALFNTNQSHAEVVRRRVHENVVTHDRDAVTGPKGRRAEVYPPERRWPRPLDERRLGLLVFRPVGVVAAAPVTPMVGGRPVSPRP